MTGGDEPGQSADRSGHTITSAIGVLPFVIVNPISDGNSSPFKMRL